LRLARADLALLDGASDTKKLGKKTKKTKEPQAKSKEAAGATKVPKDPMKATFQADLEKAKKATKDTKGTMNAATSKMFMFYANLLSPKSKYSWNKIGVEQMESNPFVDLQGVSQEGPRGMSHESFDECVVFHLLTLFPINAAEQEKYYTTNVLKKPQRVNIHQFIRSSERQILDLAK
jgi:hypothetical protein